MVVCKMSRKKKELNKQKKCWMLFWSSKKESGFRRYPHTWTHRDLVSHLHCLCRENQWHWTQTQVWIRLQYPVFFAIHISHLLALSHSLPILLVLISSPLVCLMLVYICSQQCQLSFFLAVDNDVIHVLTDQWST